MKHACILQDLMEKPLQEAREEARKEARQEAFQEGIKLGERKRAITNLMAVLDARFQEQDVDLFKPTFEAITDLQLLRLLNHTALHAPTFDDVMQTLRDYRKNEA